MMLKGILLFQGQLRKVSLEDWGGDGWCAKSASFQNQNSLGASLDPLLCTVDIISNFNPVANSIGG